MSGTIRILGLDPGLSAMGWGVIAVEGSRLTHVAHGVIATKPALGLGLRLMELHRTLALVIAEHGPGAIAVEQAFVAKDPNAALKIGHARAVALLAAAQAGLEIAEYLGFQDDFLKRAFQYRTQLDPHSVEMEPKKRSRYNAKKWMNSCEECGSKTELHTHHIQPQKDATTDGYIGTYHKNKLFNLKVLCRRCHEKEHHHEEHSNGTMTGL